MKEVAVNTVQGIGDIFWVYQKLAPYFDRIHLNILCLSRTEIQLRATPFCKMLPKVGKVQYVPKPSKDYQRIAQGRFSISQVQRASKLGRIADYAVNAPLEMGIKLRDVDPGSDVLDFVDMGLPAEVARDDYLCVYVSGGSGKGERWMPKRWVPVIEKLARRYDTRRIKLIGAPYDKHAQDEVFDELAARYAVQGHVGAALPESIDIIRRSRFFLGYQSGLNVIAENYNVPQLMIYFDKLAPMMYTWCKPASVQTIFHAVTFSGDVNGTIAALPLPAEEVAA